MDRRQPKVDNFDTPRKTAAKTKTNVGKDFDYLFGIYRYDKDCKRVCPSSQDAQPYLHCAVLLHKLEEDKYIYTYIIYIWDQRKVLFKSMTYVNRWKANQLKSMFRTEYLLQARDNLHKVEGQPEVFNEYLSK